MTAQSVTPLPPTMANEVAAYLRSHRAQVIGVGLWLLLITLSWKTPQSEPVAAVYRLTSGIGFGLWVTLSLMSLLDLVPMRVLLRFPIALFSLQWCVGHTGDELWAEATAQPASAAAYAIAFGLTLTATYFASKRILPTREEHPAWEYAEYAAHPAQEPSELTTSDRKHVAYHEAAHALVHAAMRTPSVALTMTIYRNARWGQPNGRVTITPPHRLDRESYVQLRLLVFLAGQVGERMRMGETTVGGGRDNEQWLRAAKCYLASCEDVIFYASPLNEQEIEHNNRELTKLKSTCREQVRQFLERNEHVHRALADALLEREHMTLEDIQPFFRLVTFPAGFPRPD